MVDPRELERIFCDAKVIESDTERNAFLDRECGANQELRQAVDDLLSIDRAIPQEFLAIRQPPPHPRLKPDDIVDQYRIVSVIKEGGMAVVYKAVQIQPIRRETALKVIKPELASEELKRRFRVESQALAMLKHENIATIFDAGETDAGLPYLAMELVDGMQITDFCDQKRLPIGDRMALFLQVCEGVAHAHIKRVIHRDIKPSNILVTDDGQTKIIDFGVAKVFEQQWLAGGPATADGVMVGTPRYMSPEQAEANNLDVDTRSDVYSLGILLYELLVGRTPLDPQQLQALSHEETRDLVLHKTPLKPSECLREEADRQDVVCTARRISPKKLERQLRLDLDWIVTKALAKDRDKRYQHVTTLKEDVEGFLEGKPVMAHPRSRAYTVRKYVSVHKLKIGLAVIGIAVVLALLTMSEKLNMASVMRRQVERRLTRAQGELSQTQGKLRQNEKTLAQQHEELDRTNGELQTRREQLEQLSDLVDVKYLKARANSLGPASSYNMPAFSEWLGRASQLVQQRDQYGRSLEQQRGEALPYNQADNPYYPGLLAARRGKAEMLSVWKEMQQWVRPVTTTLSRGYRNASGRISHYFRHNLDIEEVKKPTSLKLQLVVDDGVLVYLNGQVLARYNMPEGEIRYNSVSRRPIPSDGRDVSIAIDNSTGLLQPGRNVVAAELHQCDPSSPDARFDLQLIAENEGRKTDILIPYGAPWSYQDRGQQPGELWTMRDFEATGWSRGEAPFGYNKLTEFEKRLAEHEATIQVLEKLTSTRHKWRFSDPERQWWHDVTAELVEGLADLENLMAYIRKRQRFAANVQAESLQNDIAAELWNDAITCIGNREKCPHYNGLVLEPVEGLLPLGQDPSSGLWEFAHLETGTPAMRNEKTGIIESTGSSGIVFVLLPGGTFDRGAEHPCGIVEQTEDGLRVRGIPDESFASSLGLEVGDTIKGINGEDVANNADLDAVFANLKIGEGFELTLLRLGSPFIVSGTVVENLDCLAEPDESPVCTIEISPFFLSKYEMTQGQWFYFTEDNPSVYKAGVHVDHMGRQTTLCHPVENVSWQECAQVMANMGLRLPTEAQLEYAARAGTTTRWWTGNNPKSLEGKENLNADFFPDSYAYHAPVGSFAANPFGLFDTSGNVLEWCADWFGRYSEPYGRNDGRIAVASLNKMARGGSHLHDHQSCRTTRRWPLAATGNPNIGLRPALMLRTASANTPQRRKQPGTK